MIGRNRSVMRILHATLLLVLVPALVSTRALVTLEVALLVWLLLVLLFGSIKLRVLLLLVPVGLATLDLLG